MSTSKFEALAIFLLASAIQNACACKETRMAMDDTPIRLLSNDQLDSCVGKTVVVRGRPENMKAYALVVTDFAGFPLVGLDHWPSDALSTDVEVIGTLLWREPVKAPPLDPDAPIESVEYWPDDVRPGAYVIEEARWRAVSE